jgi:hypothetical protein
MAETVACAICGTEITSQHGRYRAKRRGYGYCSYSCDAAAKAKKADEDAAMRFMRRVNMAKGDECWTFQGRLSNKGYATFDWRAPWEDRSRGHPASRMMWLILNGRIPDDLEVCHSCDNPACCNPEHLWLGTHKENMEDMSKKGRGGKAGRKGSAHHGAKLREADVLAIRTATASISDLARQYAVTEENIHRILKRKTWTHI